MPVSLDQFSEEFAKLQAAFGSTRSPKVAEQWLAEFEDCDFPAFFKTMKRLQRGERFPTWGVFWEQYRYFADSLGMGKPKFNGCGGDKCFEGKIFFRALYIHRDIEGKEVNRAVKELVGFCWNCVPRDELWDAKAKKNYQGLYLVNPDRLDKCQMGIYRLPEALEHDTKTGNYDSSRMPIFGSFSDEIINNIFEGKNL